jgi:hypothetical protein
MCRLAPLHYGGGDVRRQESKLEIASNVSFVAMIMIGNLANRFGIAAAKLSPPCMRPNEGRHESRIGPGFGARLVANHKPHLTAAPPELGGNNQPDRSFALFGTRPCRLPPDSCSRSPTQLSSITIRSACTIILFTRCRRRGRSALLGLRSKACASLSARFRAEIASRCENLASLHRVQIRFGSHRNSPICLTTSLSNSMAGNRHEDSEVLAGPVIAFATFGGVRRWQALAFCIEN